MCWGISNSPGAVPYLPKLVRKRPLIRTPRSGRCSCQRREQFVAEGGRPTDEQKEKTENGHYEHGSGCCGSLANRRLIDSLPNISHEARIPRERSRNRPSREAA